MSMLTFFLALLGAFVFVGLVFMAMPWVLHGLMKYSDWVDKKLNK